MLKPLTWILILTTIAFGLSTGYGISFGQEGSPSNQNAQALMTIDIDELKDTLMDAKQALANGNTEEALTSITDIENQLLTLQSQPTFTSVFQKIKDSIAKDDFKRAIIDISKVQIEVIKAEAEIYISQLPTT